MNKSTIKAIEDFLIIKSDKIEKADLCFCFRFPRPELSNIAAKLFKKRHCEYILIAGGKARSPKTYDKIFKDITEAEWHLQRLIKLGVPKERIILSHFKKIPLKIIVIHKVFHGRRAIMTLGKNLSKQTKYILQLVETPNHQIKNWRQNKRLKNHLIDEIRKIGEYTLKDDLGLD